MIDPFRALGDLRSHHKCINDAIKYILMQDISDHMLEVWKLDGLVKALAL